MNQNEQAPNNQQKTYAKKLAWGIRHSSQILINNILIYNQFYPQMKVLAAYALLALSGKKDISAADVKGVLSSVQVNASDDDINRLITSLKGKTIHQLIAEGSAKIGGGSAPAASAAKDAKKDAPKKEEPKKKQQPKKKEEPKPEEDEDMGLGGGLFD